MAMDMPVRELPIFWKDVKKVKLNERVNYFFSDPKDTIRKFKFFILRRIGRPLNVRFYSAFGKHSIVYRPLRVMGSKNITIGDNVTVNAGAYLYALSLTESIPKLIINSGSTLGHMCHVVSIDEVIIEKNVLIADRVYIGDNAHIYTDISIPIINQGVKKTGRVLIGEGSWIGDNVAIISCKIGKHCIIGANSVVNKDIPDYCVVCGNPAKIVKKYNLITKQWEKTI